MQYGQDKWEQHALELEGVCFKLSRTVCPQEPQSTETCWMTLSLQLSLDSYFCEGVREVILIPILPGKPGSEPSLSPGTQFTDTEAGLEYNHSDLSPNQFPPRPLRLPSKILSCVSYKDTYKIQTFALTKLTLICQDSRDQLAHFKPVGRLLALPLPHP